MAGTCITTIKLLGVGSLGLLTSSIIYQSLTNLPDLIHQFNTQFNSSSIDYFNKKLSNLKHTIGNNRLINGVLTALSTGLFTLAFKYAPTQEKHPYLIYASIGAPLSLIALYYKNWNYEEKILSQKSVPSVKALKSSSADKDKKSSSSASTSHDTTEPTDPDYEIISKVTSADSLLGKSYVHLSDESGISTPNSSHPSSPQVQPEQQPQAEEEKGEKSIEEIEVDQEVENILIKKEIIQDLKKIESGYTLSSYISSISFLIASVGLFGDYYLL